MSFNSAILKKIITGLYHLWVAPHDIDDQPEFKPKLRGQISSRQIREILQEKFPGAAIFVSDKHKFLCDISDINVFLEQDKTNHYTYEAEYLDCDDFTFMLMGQFSKPGWAKLAKFIVWNYHHALMGFIDTNLDFWWVEPQNDSVQSELNTSQGSASTTYLIVG